MAINFSKYRTATRVYETRNYEDFHEMEFNRAASEERINKLIASYGEKEILNPIVVNEKMEIVDGQGRFEALRRLGRSIKFVVAQGAKIEDCRRMNLYNTKWDMKDFIGSYIKQGNENYIELYRCSKRINRSYEKILAALGMTGTTRRTVIFSGKLEFTPETTELVARIAQEVDAIKQALDIQTEPSKFFAAVKTMLNTDGYDSKHMIQNCGKERATYRQGETVRSILVEFSRIYNKRCKDKLHFEDALSNRGYAVREYGTHRDEKDSKTLRK